MCLEAERWGEMLDPLDDVLDEVEAERLQSIGEDYGEFGGMLEGSEEAIYGEHGGVDPVTGLRWVP